MEIIVFILAVLAIGIAFGALSEGNKTALYGGMVFFTVGALLIGSMFAYRFLYPADILVDLTRDTRDVAVDSATYKKQEICRIKVEESYPLTLVFGYALRQTIDGTCNSSEAVKTVEEMKRILLVKKVDTK